MRPAEREVVLREACAGDPGLRTEVDRLLAGDARADEEGFLRVPDEPSSTQDQVCDRFEATWRAGDRPPIAVYPPPEIPGYEILSELGRGGMAVVFKARQLRLNRLCALKMIPPGGLAGAELPVRLLAEAETIARMRHPNVVQIYGLGDHDGRLYFEMEYIEGGNLAHQLNDTPWAHRPAAQMVAVLARAVEHAHRLGIVHRDLKPANVRMMADGTPKVADFGLAKSLKVDSNLTQSGVFLGTPSYTAPEQVECLTKMVGPAADIYALGAIFYHMLTGRPPFKAATVLQTLAQVKAADPVPPSRLQPGLPRDAETLALKCLHKDPLRRYASAADLAADLDRFLAGQAILARPTGAAERFWKWSRRRPAVALLSAAVVAVTVLGFALVSWQWRSAERARRDAIEKQAQLTSNQGLALCDQGELGRGLLWLARGLELATEAQSEDINRTIRINLADWWGQLSRPVRLPPMRHSSPILGFAFRRAGRTLVSVGKDRVARTWDMATGEEVEPSLELEGDRPGRVVFGPPGGGLLATVDEGGRATFWNLDRRQRAIFPAGHLPGPRVRDLTFSPDLKRFITCSEEGELRWWDMTTRTPVGEPLWHRRGGCTTTALSLDGRTLVTGGQDRRVLRWDVATGRTLEPELLYDSPIEAIALTPDGREIIAGTRAGGLHVWDADSGRGFHLPPQGTGVTSLAVSPDGRLLASGTEGGIVRLWDTSLLGQIGQTYKLAGAITSLAFDPGGRILAMGEDDGTIRLWEVPRQKALGPPLRVKHPVQIVTFGKDGEHLLIGSTEGARWWDLASRKTCEPAMHDEYKLNRVEARAVGPDGRTLATARCVGEGGRARGWVELRDVATGAYLRQTPEQPRALTGLSYSPDSKWLLTWGHEPGTARLWDVDTVRDSRLLRSLKSAINQAAFSRDGGTLLLACRDHRARLWDLKRDVEIDSKLRPRHAYPITAVAFDPKRSRVVTGCHAGTVRVWDATEGRILTELRENAGEIVVLAFNRNGDTLLTASCDGTARFLDAESGRQLGPILQHTAAVLCAAFHPDGQSVVTGTQDGMVQRWRVPPLPMTGGVGEIRRRLEQHIGMELDEQGAILPPHASGGEGR